MTLQNHWAIWWLEEKAAFIYLSNQKNLKLVKFKPHTRSILSQMRLFKKNPNVYVEGRIVAYDLSVAGVAQLLAATWIRQTWIKC